VGSRLCRDAQKRGRVGWKRPLVRRCKMVSSASLGFQPAQPGRGVPIPHRQAGSNGPVGRRSCRALWELGQGQWAAWSGLPKGRPQAGIPKRSQRWGAWQRSSCDHDHEQRFPVAKFIAESVKHPKWLRVIEGHRPGAVVALASEHGFTCTSGELKQAARDGP
jgi:hypothetical protein